MVLVPTTISGGIFATPASNIPSPVLGPAPGVSLPPFPHDFPMTISLAVLIQQYLWPSIPSSSPAALVVLLFFFLFYFFLGKIFQGSQVSQQKSTSS